MVPQVSVYVDRRVLEESNERARQDGVSLSGFVTEALRARLDSQWPAGFGQAYGSIEDATFARPDQLDFAADAVRGQL
jgi:hypothetical protein